MSSFSNDIPDDDLRMIVEPLETLLWNARATGIQTERTRSAKLVQRLKEELAGWFDANSIEIAIEEAIAEFEKSCGT